MAMLRLPASSLKLDTATTRVSTQRSATGCSLSLSILGSGPSDGPSEEIHEGPEEGRVSISWLRQGPGRQNEFTPGFTPQPILRSENKNGLQRIYCNPLILLTISGRCERIRTFDPLHPMQVRYQAAPHTELLVIIAAQDSRAERCESTRSIVGRQQLADLGQFAPHHQQLPCDRF